MDSHRIFQISTAAEFRQLSLEIFQFQYGQNEIYREFCNHLNVNSAGVEQLDQIPFLPIEFFRTEKILVSGFETEALFLSSATTSSKQSAHHIGDIELYRQSFLRGFERRYGPVSDYCILALLPSYQEQGNSSLIYMVQDLISRSQHPDSGFFLREHQLLADKLKALDTASVKVVLIGVSYALLDLVEDRQFALNNTIIMETGGMKGRKREMVREELHARLKAGFGVSHIHSEYGMTELLSQAYSSQGGIFYPPPWMQVLIRDTEDPLTYLEHGKNGGLNIIDLANIYSCPFIATQDLGKQTADGGFEVLGRFDHSDLRGCNLMAV